MNPSSTGQESDFLGTRSTPAAAYRGAHTAYTVDNFPISDRQRAGCIAAACDDLTAERLHKQFVVDVIHGGAGTSTNTNANDVIANRAFELIKAAEFADVPKIGRTQPQDAVPTMLGQELTAFLVMIGEDEQRLNEAHALFTEVNMGATPVGTGIHAPAGHRETVVPLLTQLSGVPVVPEVMNQAAFEVIGNDVTITMAAEFGQLQLDAFEPIMACSPHKGVRHLRQACRTLRVPERLTRPSRRAR